MKLNLVLKVVICVFSASLVNALSSDEITDLTDTCCTHVESIAISAPSLAACAAAKLPEDVESYQEDICRTAMNTCCEALFQEKDDCSAGMELAPSKRCHVPKTDVGKTCCEECSFGRWTGEAQGKDGCGSPASEGVSPQSALRKNAYFKCCMDAANTPETTTEKKVITTTTEKKVPTTTTEKPVPTTEKPAPTTEKPAPTTEKPAPTTEKPAPTTEKPAPTTEKPAPTTEKPAPTTEKPAPTTEKPAPTTGKPAPTTEKPAPTTEKPAPTTEKPAPTKEKPAPTTEKPAPTTEKPAPTTEKPAPTTGKPAPTTEKPAPTTTTAKPVPSTTREKKFETTTEKLKPKQTCANSKCEHNCDDKGGVVRCSCREGYRLQADGKSCKDINECLEALDDLCTAENTVCHNVPGTFKCVPMRLGRDVGLSCPAGFKRNVVNQVCDDINECQLPRPPCPKYLCENTIGGYKCAGKPGKPFEEAVPGAPNTQPTSSSMPAPKIDICPLGFRAGADDECIDIDECDEHTDDCQRLSQHCINTHGSFFCQDHVSKRCAPGFAVNTATGICEDIDECEESSEVCKRSEVCINLPGAYNCKSKISTLPKLATKTCQEGTRLRPGGKICEDIDECREGSHLCDQFQNCINTFGAHECRCKNGFELDSASGSCVDVDECALKLDNCGSGLHCLNVLGSFTCTRRAVTSSTTTTPSPDEYEYYYSDEENSTVEEEPHEVIPTTPSTTTTPRPTTPRRTTPRATTPRSTTYRTTTPRPTTTPKPTTTPRPTTPKPTITSKPTTPSTSRYYTTSTTLRPTRIPYTPSIPPPPELPPRPDDEEDLETPSKPEKPPIPSQPDYGTTPEDSLTSYNPYRTNETEEYPSRPEEYPRRPDYRIPDTSRRPDYRRPTTPRRPATRRPEPTPTISVPTTTEDNRIDDPFDPNEVHCLNGYEKDVYGNCIDIDECRNDRHICGSLEVCKNQAGGYSCECIAGFVRGDEGWCQVATTSSTTTSSTTTERTTVAATSPEWPSTPYTPRPPPRGGDRVYPTAVIPTSCELGYTSDATVGTCVDIDECATNKDTCAAEEDCINMDGGFRCACGRRCRAINESPTYVPVQPSPPRQPSEPGNNVITVGAQYGQRGTWSPRPSYSRDPQLGSILTSCPWGYRLTPDRRCYDIDECAKNTSECGPQQRCENFYGGYSCQCPAGHKLVGQNGCDDIDECMHGNPCSYNAQCINTVGSYRCECSEGFRNAPTNDKVCVDVDECTETPHVCQQGCANAWGGYRCFCKRGYRLGNDNRTCVDVDECEEWSSVRHRGRLCGGECVNEPGSYRCSCPAGYRLSEDQRSCIDIDECETGEATCAHTSDPGFVCQNTRGSYHCHHIECPAGYKLEAKHRCTRITRSCPIADWSCLQQPSSYSYNFITFVANIYLPSGRVDLFTMHGPSWSDSVVSFEMRMIDAQASKGVTPADLRCFDMRPSGSTCAISLLCPLEGPQVAELELTMSLYQRGQFAGSAVARLIIIVSQYEF